MTAQRVQLSMEPPLFDEDGASVDIAYDQESGQGEWIWLLFATDEEPWIKLRFSEARKLRDALTYQITQGGLRPDIETEDRLT